MKDERPTGGKKNLYTLTSNLLFSQLIRLLTKLQKQTINDHSQTFSKMHLDYS